MSKHDRPLPQLRPSSAPPQPAHDANWDDETAPGIDLDEPLNEFDRVTVVPDLPSDQYVKSVMEAADDSRIPVPPGPLVTPQAERPQTLAPDEYFSLDSGAPPPQRSADSTAPYPAIAPHDTPTARPEAVTIPVRSPGVPPHSPSVTGLQLADLDSLSGLLKAPPVGPPPAGREAQDRVMGLSFDDQEPSWPHKAAPSGPLGDMKDRYAMGDFSGALVIAEGILESSPENLEAARFARSCRDVLIQMYSARLGSLDQIVAVSVPNDQVRWLTLDHRAGFLLSLIDGGSTLDQILDMSGMTRLDALRIMYQLFDQRVISLAP
jgi:hypothetical protein